MTPRQTPTRLLFTLPTLQEFTFARPSRSADTFRGLFHFPAIIYISRDKTSTKQESGCAWLIPVILFPPLSCFFSTLPLHPPLPPPPPFRVSGNGEPPAAELSSLLLPPLLLVFSAGLSLGERGTRPPQSRISGTTSSFSEALPPSLRGLAVGHFT